MPSVCRCVTRLQAAALARRRKPLPLKERESWMTVHNQGNGARTSSPTPPKARRWRSPQPNAALSSIGQLDPGRCMIARLLPTADLPVHLRRSETVDNRRAKQQVVDPKTRVPRPCIPEIVPEGVDALTRMKRPHRISPTLRQQTAERVADLGPEQRIIDPALRFINIEFGGHHVEIAG